MPLLLAALLLAPLASALWNPFAEQSDPPPAATNFPDCTAAPSKNKKPCASCDSPVILKAPDSVPGNTSFRIDYYANGCMLAEVTCRGTDEYSPAIVEFNQGAGGTLEAVGKIVVELQCSDDKKWVAVSDGHALDVDSLSCDSA